MPKRDYYDILGVDEKASADTIKKAYRKLAKDYHPDTHPGDTEAEVRFKEISEAYGALGDPKKRQQYDQMRRFGFSDARPGGGFYSQGAGFDLNDLFRRSANSGRQGTGGRGGFKLDELFEFGGLGDLFGQVFDRENGFGQNSGRTEQRRDIHADLEIPFDTAIRGGKAVFSIDKDEACSVCNGTGSKNAKAPETCPECKGSGMVSKSQGVFAVNRPCPRCLGRGQIIKKVCNSCRGRGRTKVKKKYSVNLLPGTETGKKIRLAGQGNPGEASQPPGDLIINIRVAKHRFFRARGLDIYCDIPLDKRRAAQGTNVRVKTAHGDTVELKIPPDTGDGRTFRLKGMGIKGDKGQGDQFVKISIR